VLIFFLDWRLRIRLSAPRRSPTLTSPSPIPAVMAEVTATGSPLMGAVNKIKDSAMHVFAQVRAARSRSRNATPTCRVAVEPNVGRRRVGFRD